MLNENLAQVELPRKAGSMLSEEFPSAGEGHNKWNKDGTEMTEASEQTPDTIVMNTRYGEITFRSDQLVTMTRPVLGFPELSLFGMVPLPGYADKNLVLLQSMEDENVSFPCIALDMVNTMIEKEDIAAVYEQYKIKEEDGAVLCILTVRENETTGETEITANLRAPVFVDTIRREGWQVVMANQRYQIRQTL